MIRAGSMPVLAPPAPRAARCCRDRDSGRAAPRAPQRRAAPPALVPSGFSLADSLTSGRPSSPARLARAHRRGSPAIHGLGCGRSVMARRIAAAGARRISASAADVDSARALAAKPRAPWPPRSPRPAALALARAAAARQRAGARRRRRSPTRPMASWHADKSQCDPDLPRADRRPACRLAPIPITGKPGWWTRMVGPGKPIDTGRVTSSSAPM